AMFNLIGGWIPGKIALDLFAGTGAVGIEALSRGASQVFFNERHFPTARLIKQNLDALEPGLPAVIETSDTFFWVRQFLKSAASLPQDPWVIFCCPPYRLYQTQREELMAMIESLLAAAPLQSVMVVESDESFDCSQLPRASEWRIRQYRPAQIAVWR
ncbi:MAG TPA: RsmD family RNA methyltransferase, partial [Pirellulaceae bacterium]|nr:RsmD family RNA methyltransferase [Pirellulaceae bacterium]